MACCMRYHVSLQIQVLTIFEMNSIIIIIIIPLIIFIISTITILIITTITSCVVITITSSRTLGSPRQCIHADTIVFPSPQYPDVHMDPLYTFFIALQDVTADMGKINHNRCDIICYHHYQNCDHYHHHHPTILLPL